jgi:hypothetical protein
MHAALGDLLTAQIRHIPHIDRDDPEHLSFTRGTWLRIACMFQRGMPVAVDVSDDDACWCLDLTAARGYPTIHVKITAAGIDKRFNAHRLMFKMFNPGVPMTLGDRTHQVSHRCGASKCVNPKHLVVENDSANKNRNYCRFGSLQLCPHTPQCVF